MTISRGATTILLIFLSIAIIIGYFSIGLPAWIMLIGTIIGIAASMMLKPYVIDP